MYDSPRNNLASTSRSQDGDSEECTNARQSILASSSGARLHAPSRQAPWLMFAAERSQAWSQHPSRPNRTNRIARTSRTGSTPSTRTPARQSTTQLAKITKKGLTGGGRSRAATRGCARRWSIPGGGGDGGRLFSLDAEGRCSGSAREGVGWPGARFRRRYGQNCRRRAGRKQGRAAAEGGGKERGLKCPSRQLLLCDAGHCSREGKPAFSRVGVRNLPRAPKLFAGRGGMRGLAGQAFRPVPAFWRLFYGSGANAGSARVALRASATGHLKPASNVRACPSCRTDGRGSHENTIKPDV